MPNTTAADALPTVFTAVMLKAYEIDTMAPWNAVVDSSTETKLQINGAPPEPAVRHTKYDSIGGHATADGAALRMLSHHATPIRAQKSQ
jgi:hypothetical protein